MGNGPLQNIQTTDMKGDDVWGTIFGALDDVYRRRLLVALLDCSGDDDALSVPEDVHEGDVTLEQLQLDLYHRHLPLLEAAGYVRWDRDAHRVGPGDSFDEIRPVLGCLDDRRDELPDGWV